MAEQIASVVAPACLHPRHEDLPPPQSHSYREIIRSSVLIGSSSAINVGIGIVRTKIMAVLLGPAGYGLMGAYMLISELARSVAQVGINSSGVRQIAEASASHEPERLARTVAVLRYTSFACGALGATTLALLARPVSILTFGTPEHSGSVALLAVAVFFTVVAGGQGALLQGVRRIADMAKLSILGGLLGTLVGIPMVLVFGEHGLVPTIVAVAIASAGASWWFSRRVHVVVPTLSLRDVQREAKDLLKLGFAFMASGLLTAGAAYVVRIIVLRKAGLEAAGVYFAAWTLGGLYIGFILQALGTDFYPRLVGVASDDSQCNRLVNEQTRVSLLLAVPGVLMTITCAPFVIDLFYTTRFAPAVGVLRWICLGMALRVLTWPIGFIVVAKNRQVAFFGIEVAWTLVNVALTWWCVEAFGLNGAGIAFFASYVFHGLLVYPIVRSMSGFRWTRTNQLTAACSFSGVLMVFVTVESLPTVPATAIGLAATGVSALASIRTLVNLLSSDVIPKSLRRWLPRSGPDASHSATLAVDQLAHARRTRESHPGTPT